MRVPRAALEECCVFARAQVVVYEAGIRAHLVTGKAVVTFACPSTRIPGQNSRARVLFSVAQEGNQRPPDA
jgi:hypothetical protein